MEEESEWAATAIKMTAMICNACDLTADQEDSVRRITSRGTDKPNNLRPDRADQLQ
jgi:hypothetical protein